MNNDINNQELQQLQREIGEWSDKTFPNKTRDSIVEHLRREAKELEQSHEPSKAADILILLCNYAHFHKIKLKSECGFVHLVYQGKGYMAQTIREHCDMLIDPECHYPEFAELILFYLIDYANICEFYLMEETKKKMEINYKRQWQEPVAMGVVEHVRTRGA